MIGDCHGSDEYTHYEVEISEVNLYPSRATVQILKQKFIPQKSLYAPSIKPVDIWKGKSYESSYLFVICALVIFLLLWLAVSGMRCWIMLYSTRKNTEDRVLQQHCRISPTQHAKEKCLSPIGPEVMLDDFFLETEDETEPMTSTEGSGTLISLPEVLTTSSSFELPSLQCDKSKPMFLTDVSLIESSGDTPSADESMTEDAWMYQSLYPLSVSSIPVDDRKVTESVLQQESLHRLVRNADHATVADIPGE